MPGPRSSLVAAILTVSLLSGCFVLVPVPTRAPVSTGTVESPGATDSFGAALNSERAASGLAPVSRNTRLTAAAQAHAQDMAARGYLAHTSPDGVSYTARMRAHGYRNCLAAEAISRGIRSTGHALQSWMDSPPHRSLLMHPQVQEYGVGESGGYWALVLASPC